MYSSSHDRINPRRRRLESDRTRLEQLSSQSSIFSFEVSHPMPSVGPPETYRIRFKGPSLQLVGSRFKETVHPHHDHEVLIQLVAEYPRSAPHMRWLTPIFHPNISAAGAVCLGGWGTHWAPSLQLDRLCEMLWDMLRFANYDTRSPFNQQAAVWLRSQREYRFPLDSRELRDRLAPMIDGPADVPVAAENNAAPDDWIRFDGPVHQHHPEPIPSDDSRRGHGAPRAGGHLAGPPPDILFLD